MKSVFRYSIMVLFLGVSVTKLSEEDLHPVRQEVVDHIKKSTTSWVPIEVEDNPLRNYSVADFKRMNENLRVYNNDIASYSKKLGLGLF